MDDMGATSEIPEVGGMDAVAEMSDALLPEVTSPLVADALPEVSDLAADALPEVAVEPAVDPLPEVSQDTLPEVPEEYIQESAELLQEEPLKEEVPEPLEEQEAPKEPEEQPPEEMLAEATAGSKRKLEEEEKSRKKQKIAEKAAGEKLELSLSLEEVQSLMDLKEAAVNANRSFYTIDALLFACKKAMETQPDFNEQTGLRIELQLLPTHLTYQQLIQFRAQILCHRLLVRNMQPPDRVLHTARGGYNKKELEYAEFRRNLLPNIPETILEMNEYDKQSRIELANRRAKFWTDLQANGF